MAAPSTDASTRVRRNALSTPFGWGAVTDLLVGATLLIIGIAMILYGFFGLFVGTIGAATGPSFTLGTFFHSFFGAMILFVVGGVLGGVGGWFVRLW